MRRGRDQGFALIDLLFVCGIIGLLSGIALPRLAQTRGAAASASAIASMRTIASSQVAFAITCGNGFYAPSLTTLAKPPAGSTNGFIQADLGSANKLVKTGYTIQMSATPFAGAVDTCNVLGPGVTGQAFKAAADPLDAGNITRYFGINASGVVWEDTASLFGVIPEAGDSPSGHPLR